MVSIYANAILGRITSVPLLYRMCNRLIHIVFFVRPCMKCIRKFLTHPIHFEQGKSKE